VIIKLQSQEQKATYQQTIVQLSIEASEDQQQILYTTENQIVLQFEV
jgi:hypothetical protein